MIIFISILTLEGTGYVFNKILYDIDYSNAQFKKEQFLEELFPEDVSVSRPRIIHNLPRELHPYFGFTLQHDLGRTNNQGFISNVDYPYNGEDDEFVVGIFGGSVSIQVAFRDESREILERRLLEILLEKGYKKVTILSIGNGAWKQPQTFYALIYFLDTIDMAIIIDGFNEVVQLNQAISSNWPVRYPWSTIYKILASSEYSPENLQHISKLNSLSNKGRMWTKIFEASVINRSQLAHALWGIGAQRIQKNINLERKILQHITEKNINSLSTTTEIAVENNSENYFRFYTDISRWQNLITKKEGVPIFHFIQPNQYVRNSKPYSKEELKKYLTHANTWTDMITSYYIHLEQIALDLKKEGVHIVSLANIFFNTQETVYSDNCCHLNSLGLSIVANKIVDSIEDSKILNRFETINN